MITFLFQDHFFFCRTYLFLFRETTLLPCCLPWSRQRTPLPHWCPWALTGTQPDRHLCRLEMMSTWLQTSFSKHSPINPIDVDPQNETLNCFISRDRLLMQTRWPNGIAWRGHHIEENQSRYSQYYSRGKGYLLCPFVFLLTFSCSFLLHFDCSYQQQDEYAFTAENQEHVQCFTPVCTCIVSPCVTHER